LVDTGTVVATAHCPEKCGLSITYQKFSELLCKEDFEKYKTYFINRIVDQSDYHLWCPG
jgi:hypothetical protein